MMIGKKINKNGLGVLSILVSILSFLPDLSVYSQTDDQLDLPDQLIVEAYEKASSQNVLAAVNDDSPKPSVFI